MTDSIVEWEKLQPKDWYVLRDGELSQPMSETQVCAFVFQESLPDDVKISQGESDFFPVSEVRALFAALRHQGWYVRSAGKIYGPFVGDKFLTLVTTRFFEAGAIQVRQGTRGDWVRFEAAKRSFERQSRKLKKRLARQQRVADAAAPRQSSDRVGETTKTHDAGVSSQAESPWRFDSDPAEQANPFEQMTTAASRESQSSGDVEHSGLQVSKVRDRKRQRNKTRVCISCDQEHHEKTLLCLACAAKKKKQDAELAKHKKRIQGVDTNHTENLIVKVLLLVVAFGASGFFLSKWLVTSVVWKESFVQDQQTIGWVHFVLGGVLLLVGAAVIWFDPYRKGDRRLIATAAVSLLLVGGSCLAVDYGRLESNRQQMQTQNDAWTELMLNGGYGEDKP